jgi:hypothetical protein
MRSLTVTAAVDFCAIEVSAFRSIRYLLIGSRADSFYHNFDSWVTLDQTVFVLDSISDERIVYLAYFLSPALDHNNKRMRPREVSQRLNLDVRLTCLCGPSFGQLPASRA